MQEEQRNRAFFSRIPSHFEAIEMIQDTSKALLIVAALQAVSAMLGNHLGLIDACLDAACAIAIRWRRSRAAAVIALTLATATLVFGFIPSVSFYKLSTSGLIFALLAVWAAARALEAVVLLRGKHVRDPLDPGLRIFAAEKYDGSYFCKQDSRPIWLLLSTL